MAPCADTKGIASRTAALKASILAYQGQGLEGDREWWPRLLEVTLEPRLGVQLRFRREQAGGCRRASAAAEPWAAPGPRSGLCCLGGFGSTGGLG